MKKSLIALTMLSVFVLAGCGQTGPLYMPKDKSTNADTQTSSTASSPSTETSQAQQ